MYFVKLMIQFAAIIYYNILFFSVPLFVAHVCIFDCFLIKLIKNKEKLCLKHDPFGPSDQTFTL